MDGLAYSRATRPVVIKMPAPMIAPIPSAVSVTGPRTRRRRFSSAPRGWSNFGGNVANNCFQSRTAVPSVKGAGTVENTDNHVSDERQLYLPLVLPHREMLPSRAPSFPALATPQVP